MNCSRSWREATSTPYSIGWTLKPAIWAQKAGCCEQLPHFLHALRLFHGPLQHRARGIGVSSWDNEHRNSLKWAEIARCLDVDCIINSLILCVQPESLQPMRVPLLPLRSQGAGKCRPRTSKRPAADRTPLRRRLIQ